MQLKPQDLLVALKLVAWDEQRWTYARLSHELGISASEAHACVKRGVRAGLLVKNESELALARKGTRAAKGSGIHRSVGRSRREIEPQGGAGADNPARIQPRQLLEFVVHGSKYAFVPDLSPVCAGVPTASMDSWFASGQAVQDESFVWPHPNGKQRGTGLKPLHPNVPYAAMQDAGLYELLALLDVVRLGRGKDRAAAIKRLATLIQPNDAAPRGEPKQSSQEPTLAPAGTPVAHIGVPISVEVANTPSDPATVSPPNAGTPDPQPVAPTPKTPRKAAVAPKPADTDQFSLGFD